MTSTPHTHTHTALLQEKTFGSNNGELTILGNMCGECRHYHIVITPAHHFQEYGAHRDAHAEGSALTIGCGFVTA